MEHCSTSGDDLFAQGSKRFSHGGAIGSISDAEVLALSELSVCSTFVTATNKQAELLKEQKVLNLIITAR
mgnify:CR=1 FL=1